MAGLFETLAKKFRQRQLQKVADWSSLVRQVAGDKPPKEADILAALEKLGRTPAELEGAVTTYQRRLELRRRADAGKKAAADKAAVEAQISAVAQRADAECAAVEARANEVIIPLSRRLEPLDAAVRLGQAALRDLAETAPPDDEAVLAELAEARQELQRVREQQGRMATAARQAEVAKINEQARAAAPPANGMVNRETHRLLQEEHQSKADALAAEEAARRKAAEDMDPDVQALERRVAELEGRIDAARLEP